MLFEPTVRDDEARSGKSCLISDAAHISKIAWQYQCNFPELLMLDLICNYMGDVITKPYFNFQRKNSEKSRFFLDKLLKK